ncbi:MAG: molybdopterin-guanine dinucleotide biosynthesis protein B [Chloroflexi bacterium]|nr:molybdopterin-guanine dinucleotide biosynthesis protein B [Chloroflexota bacterium]
MLPVLCIVGKSSSGKTTFLERLIPELKQRGYRVATVKHSSHGFDLDVAGKDSWRLLKAGSDLVLLSGPTGIARFQGASRDTHLEELAAGVEGYDLLLAEGFKGSPFPKVEVHRASLGPDLVCQEAQLAALVSDGPPPVSLRTFAPTDASGVADLLEQTYLKGKPPAEEIRLVVNGQTVSLNPFAQSVISRGLLGMVSALKGLGPVQQLTVSISRPKEAP